MPTEMMKEEVGEGSTKQQILEELAGISIMKIWTVRLIGSRS
jgi:hypothetical protein